MNCWLYWRFDRWDTNYSGCEAYRPSSTFLHFAFDWGVACKRSWKTSFKSPPNWLNCLYFKIFDGSKSSNLLCYLLSALSAALRWSVCVPASIKAVGERRGFPPYFLIKQVVRRCSRNIPILSADYNFLPRLEEAYSNCSLLPGNICPHKGYKLLPNTKHPT